MLKNPPPPHQPSHGGYPGRPLIRKLPFFLFGYPVYEGEFLNLEDYNYSDGEYLDLEPLTDD